MSTRLPPTAKRPPRAVAEPRSAAAGRTTQERFTADYLGYLLGQANHALFKDFDAAVREAGLGSLEWRVLAVLSQQPPMPMGQLAREVLSQQPTVTKLVQRLAAQEWVALSGDPADQRRTLVAITSTGQKKVTPLIRQARAHEAHALAGLSETEVQRLKDQLRRLGGGPAPDR